jgi:hypothetical protein
VYFLYQGQEGAWEGDGTSNLKAHGMGRGEVEGEGEGDEEPQSKPKSNPTR